jgi:hypothetical protein
LTVLATSISICGFVIQLYVCSHHDSTFLCYSPNPCTKHSVGLRAMNWAVTIAQLIVTAIMTTLRAAVRRGLVLDENMSRKLPKGYELDWVAKDLQRECDNWNLISWDLDDDYVRQDRIAEEVIGARCRLGELSGWESQWKKDADITANSIENTINCLFTNKDFNLSSMSSATSFKWQIVVEVIIGEYVIFLNIAKFF